MKKRIALSIAIPAAAFIAAQAASLNVGAYNIRFLTSGDTGDRAWNNRKEYVGRTIKDAAYDIVAINEMSCGTQMEDMKAMLPEYSMSGWGTDSETDPTTGTFTSVLYLTDKFELLDEGHYWLALNTEKPGISWDNTNNRRMTAWAKLRVKESGEILYYFATHLDNKGDDARNEGARINMEKIREIAGHYPAIIAGDHNSSAIRYPFYDLFSAYMLDARKVAKTPFPWSKDGSMCNWDPELKDNTRIDYIWVKGAEVNSYVHINETYGRPVTPSDHFAIKANITLNEYVPDHTRYVDASASYGGDGSKTNPYNTLQAAIDNTVCGDTIYVAAGDYAVTATGSLSGAKATINITHSLTILGGYDHEFENVTGTSRVDGKGQVYRVMTVQKPYALELRDFEITGGRAADNTTTTTGAGIACLGARLDLERVAVYGNYAKSNGGGVYAAGQLNCRKCRFEDNTSDGYGGGVYTNYSGDKLWWRFVISDCSFSGNSAMQGAGAYIGGCSRALFANNTFSGNTARQNGTVTISGATFDCKTAFVNNTFVNNRVEATSGAINQIKGGAAIYANNSSGSRIVLLNNTIVGNTSVCGTSAPADFRGGAVNIFGGTAAFFANIIAANSTNAPDGICDIVTDGGKASGKSNIYSFRESIDFKKDISDVVAKDHNQALEAIATLYGGSVADGNLQLETADEGYTFPVLAPVTGFYCGNPINSMLYSLYRENYIDADIDGDADHNGTLLADQRGVVKRTNGTGSLGSYEYDPNASASLTEAVGSVVRVLGNTLEINSDKEIGNISVYTPSGALTASYTNLTTTNFRADISSLSPGLYIVVWNGGSSKIIKH
ncbi:MAG: hypothetical protein HDS65_10250 [Bacteroidales bacterium]|nr:hypothetical protein [Bacteroidales bacterium]